MGLLILIILILCIIVFEKKIYKTFYTPSVILSIPFIVICILYDLNAEKLGFKELNYDVLYIWVFGLFFFWITGVFTNLILKRKSHVSVQIKKDNINKYGDKLVNFTFIIALILTYFVYTSYSFYQSYGGDFVEEYLGSGIQAHLIINLKLLSIICFLNLFTNRNRLTIFKNLYVIIVAIALSLLYATKSGLLILFLGYFFSWILFFNKKIKIYHVITAFGLGFGIFFITYSVVFGHLAPLDFIWNHMLLYYISGTAGMNAYFSGDYVVSLDYEMIYRPIFNTFNILFYDPTDLKVGYSEILTVIGVYDGLSINVRTFFGTLYMYGGTGIGISSVVFFSFICHVIMNRGLLNYDFIVLALYSNILAILCFGWFDFYFNSVAFYENILVTLIISFFLIRIKSQ